MDEKPSRNEEEYFRKREAELLEQQRARMHAERQRADRAVHFMKCPKCGADLAERVVDGVTVDICPECHGMWLDSGELDQLQKADSSRVTGFVRSVFGLERK